SRQEHPYRVAHLQPKNPHRNGRGRQARTTSIRARRPGKAGSAVTRAGDRGATGPGAGHRGGAAVGGESPQGTALGTAPRSVAGDGSARGGDAAGDGSAEAGPGMTKTTLRRDTPGGKASAKESDAGVPDGPETTARTGLKSGSRRARGLWTLARRHPAFSVIIATAALLRVVAMLGYQPVMYFNDSFDYLHVATDPYPHPLRPNGYAFLLLLLKPFHSFALVAAVQHLMGLAMGVMIYALLRRRFRLPGWGAALAAAPVLLDAYQLQLEHLVLSDTTFAFLVVSAVTLLLWHDRPAWKGAGAVGLLVGL